MSAICPILLDVCHAHAQKRFIWSVNVISPEFSYMTTLTLISARRPRGVAIDQISQRRPTLTYCVGSCMQPSCYNTRHTIRFGVVVTHFPDIK